MHLDQLPFKYLPRAQAGKGELQVYYSRQLEAEVPAPKEDDGAEDYQTQEHLSKPFCFSMIFTL